MVCDDSSSMTGVIAEGNKSNTKTTRWKELKNLAAVLIEFVTAINPNGLDLYFLNRGIYPNVTTQTGLYELFKADPSGRTPLLSTIRKIYRDKSDCTKQVLIIVVTDGEPSDGSLNELSQVLRNKKSNFHISFAECTDDKEAMEFLDRLDNSIPNFDNTDDYREELDRVRQQQGSAFKFTFIDYVIKILLATFVRWYFNLDQKRVAW